MRRLLLLPIVFLLNGCPSAVDQDVVTPEADKHTIKLDKELLRKCPVFDKKLVTGDEKEVEVWADAALKSNADCRRKQHSLVDTLLDIFPSLKDQK